MTAFTNSEGLVITHTNECLKAITMTISGAPPPPPPFARCRCEIYTIYDYLMIRIQYYKYNIMLL